MQPFDALSIRAVLQEAKPLLLNRKVDRVFQLARDEVLISLRSKGGTVSLFMSAQSVYGRMCLVRVPSSGDRAELNPTDRNIFERYQSKYGSAQPPNFCLTLRKHLTGATLVGVDQLPGERIIDFIFSTTDEVGTSSLKVLTAEIMGRHSNLIFWDKTSEKILASSHAVTKDMSRQREVLPGLKYERPPGQARQSVFAISESDFRVKFEELQEAFAQQKTEATSVEHVGSGYSSQPEHAESSVATRPASGVLATASTGEGTEGSTNGGSKPVPATHEQWLLSTYTGLGKHLSEEVVVGAGLDSMLANSLNKPETSELLWKQIKRLQLPAQYRPAIRADLSRYTVLGWHHDFNNDEVWKKFPSANDMVEEYFRSLEAREHFIQLREKIKAEITAESSRLENRKQIAAAHLSADNEIERLKKYGDSILTSLSIIKPGQTDLAAPDWTQENGSELTIKLNPNLSSVQNAQSYYRQYAKLRSRQGAAQSTVDEVTKRLDYLNQLRASAEAAKDISELRRIKETLSGRKPQLERSGRGDSRQQQQQRPKSGGAKNKLVSLTSSDGWTIFVGRNRSENDHLVNKVANPNDLWLHVLGQGGAHVLIRVPSNKQEPPKATILEAAQIAARLSKAGSGTKVRVIYTQVKFVKKVDPSKPGLVRYENEKTVEVDTAQPMPKFMKKLFS